LVGLEAIIAFFESAECGRDHGQFLLQAARSNLKLVNEAIHQFDSVTERYEDRRMLVQLALEPDQSGRLRER